MALTFYCELIPVKVVSKFSSSGGFAVAASPEKNRAKICFSICGLHLLPNHRVGVYYFLLHKRQTCLMQS